MQLAASRKQNLLSVNPDNSKASHFSPLSVTNRFAFANLGNAEAAKSS